LHKVRFREDAPHSEGSWQIAVDVWMTTPRHDSGFPESAAPALSKALADALVACRQAIAHRQADGLCREEVSERIFWDLSRLPTRIGPAE
jgi:hypothetical protein